MPFASFNKDMPEEQNRILTDHLSKILFCPTDTAVENLRKENIENNVFQVGDVMCDAVSMFAGNLENVETSYFIKKLVYKYDWKGKLDSWYLATVHRAENTKSINNIRVILEALEQLDAPVIFPVHPRIKGFIDRLFQENEYRNLCFVEPLGYLEMLFFIKNSIKIITDSGGLQKEAFILKKNVVTLREQTEWVETLTGNHNMLCRIQKEDIIKAVNYTDITSEFDSRVFGDGRAAEKICKILNKFS